VEPAPLPPTKLGRVTSRRQNAPGTGCGRTTARVHVDHVQASSATDWSDVPTATNQQGAVTGSGPVHRPLIVVGVDGSPHSGAALDWAIEEAVRCSADLEICTVWQPPGAGLEAYEYVPIEPTSELLASQAAHEVAELAAEQARRQLPADHVHTSVIEGGAAEELVAMSKCADLLVVGSRGRGGFAELLLGSVSHHCTSHAFCPVVVVRHLRGQAA